MPLVSARVVSLISPDAISASAYAGDDQSILCLTLVQLQGEILGDDAANHTFEWEQLSGPAITLINSNTLTPSFLDSGAADIEITLYVDRGTPYESSSTVLISSTPATTQRGTAMTSYAQQNSPTTTGSFSAFKSSGMGLPDSIDIDFSVGAYSYNYPPDSTYSPIYKAEDLVRIKEKLDGNYWLMNDIDLSDYDNWNPIGTATRPFSGELQGNGFSIDGLTITDTSTTTPAAAVQPNLPDITTLSLTDSLVNSGDITSFPNSICWTEDGLNCAIPHDVRTIEWYSASSAFDFNTLSLVTTIDADIAGTSRITQVYFKPDGTKAYLSDYTFGRVYAFNLSTPYDLTEIHGVVASQTLDPGNISEILGMWFSLDGSYLYIGGQRSGTNGITNYTLSTPWDLSTAVESSTVASSSFGSIGGRTDGIIVNGAGTRMWVVFPTGTVGVNTDKIRQIDISTPHDLTTAAYNGAFFQVNDPGVIWQTGLTWSPGSPDDIWLAYTATPRTLRKVSGDLSSGATIVEYGNAGLFAYIGNGAVIEQVGVTNASISEANSGVYKGILAGSAQGPSTDDGGAITIRDVYVEGTIEYVGGEVGSGGLIGHTGANVSSVYENNLANVDTGSDPYFDEVALLVPFDGADAATDAPDVSNNALDLTFVNDVLLDTSITKVGTASAFFDGVGGTPSAGYITIPNNPLLQFGANDFTVEGWMRFETTPGGGDAHTLCGYYNSNGVNQRSFLYGYQGGNLRLLYSTNGSTNSTVTRTWNPVADTWYHVALSRNDTDLRFFIDGVQQGAVHNIGTNALHATTAVFSIGGVEGGVGWTEFHNGWIDDFRYTLGTGRYTANFTPPAIPHPHPGHNRGSFAGYFDTAATYSDNHWNSTKDAVGAGGGGDTPIAGELDTRTWSELNNTGSYQSTWDFTDTWVTPSRYVNFRDVKLLMHMDGTDDGTTFTDSSSNAETLTASGGVTSVDQVKFGTASYFGDSLGDSVIVDGNDVITDNQGSFTMEAFVYILGDPFVGGSITPPGGRNVICAQTANGSNGDCQFGVSHDGALAWIRGGRIFNPGVPLSRNVIFLSDTGLVSDNQWYHVALSYEGPTRTARLFLDGEVVGTLKNVLDGGWPNTVQNSNMEPFTIGDNYVPSYASWRQTMNGYIDELRVTQECLYTENFVAPVQAFPNADIPGTDIALQNNIFDRVANEGAWLTSGLPQAALWNPPEVSTGGNTQIENKRYLGLIIEDQNPTTGGWENRRFIPFEQQSALLTLGRRHRAFTVLNIEPKTKSFDRTREVTYKLPNTIVPKTETDNAVFAGSTTPLATVAYPGATSVSRDIIITKTNPRKISKSVDEDAYYVQNSKDAVSKVLALDKYVGAAKSLDTVLTTEASGTLGIGSATIAIDISITRAYGGSIGG